MTGAFKRKRVYFSQVSNTALRDKKLSMKAKGLYALIQSYITLENFTLYKTTLKNQCKEGSASFEGAWKELKDAGYLVQEKIRTSGGKYRYEYDLLEEANHPPSFQGVDNPLHGKVGGYNKTYSNNTDLKNTNNQNQNHNGSFSGEKATRPFDGKEEAFSVQAMFFAEYKRHRGKEHPPLKRNQLESVIDELQDFMSERGVGPDEMADMIEKYFTSRAMRGNTDYNINHFATHGIMQNLGYSTGHVSSLDL